VFDLHIHTIYSDDGTEKPEKIASFLKKKGFKGMAIVDHHTIEGSLHALRHVDNFIVIPGTEINTPGGHILAMGVLEDIKARLPDEVVEEIHDKGGIAILAHPFRFMKPAVKKIDAVEVINARCFPSQNKKAMKYAMDRKLPQTAGSDSHYIWSLGKAYTRLQAENWQDAIEEILKGRTEVFSDYNFIHPLKCSFYSFLSYARRGFRHVG